MILIIIIIILVVVVVVVVVVVMAKNGPTYHGSRCKASNANNDTWEFPGYPILGSL